MQITYFGKDNKFAKVSPDDGYKLTSYNEETQNILFFAWCNGLTCLSEKLPMYHQISDEKVAELDARKELALADFNKASDYEDRG